MNEKELQRAIENAAVNLWWKAVKLEIALTVGSLIAAALIFTFVFLVFKFLG
jgi:hypothetical protein